MIIIDSWQDAVKPVVADPDFIVYEASLVGGEYPNYTHIQYTGAKFGRYVRGSKKGEFCYNKMIKGTRMSILVKTKDSLE